MATVGIVEWSTTLANVSSAQVVYTLNNAGAAILNRGGTAPVDLAKSNYQTLLLGLKQSSTYTFHVEATSMDGTVCKSANRTLTTGTLSGAPGITRTATNPSAQDVGFIITSTGASGSLPAIIIDADGAVVWSIEAPANCTRARMDYEGANMWMVAMNVRNTGGEMRRISMDGLTSQKNVSGLSSAHHDFTVLKGGIVAALVWGSSGTDVPSDLVEHSPDGTNETVFHIGSNLYVGSQSTFGAGSDTYHCNSVHYHATDGTYTISDRNASLYVKVTRAGALLWQFGGTSAARLRPIV